MNILEKKRKRERPGGGMRKAREKVGGRREELKPERRRLND